ncbi:MAG: amino acid synthesis family protein, partial [Actinomycetota bacterium]|nr:amino acid synthesis family protein [Actinomycetota bacterium]
MKIRSIHTGIHETHREAGTDISPATVVATSAVVVENPLAGRGRVDDLDELEALGAESAQLLIDKCIVALQS